MIFLFAFTYQIFPARATPDIPSSDPRYIGALLYHMTLPLITIVMIGFGSWAYLGKKFHGWNNARRFHYGKKKL